MTTPARTPLALALVLFALACAGRAEASPVLLADPAGTSVVAGEDPALPADPEPPLRALPAPAPATAARAALPFRVAVANLVRSGSLSRRNADRALQTMREATTVARHLRGRRRTELRAVLTNVRAITAARMLTASRLPALMLTVQRNRQWWPRGELLASGRRVRFRSSQLIWQYYPGQGLQIQWLGTFGRANGLWAYGKNHELRLLLDEARPLAAVRAGGIAFEYLLRFGGGRPPWVSGLAQGTALSAYARGYRRLHKTRYRGIARKLLGIFEQPPPAGVLLKTAAGAHYLQYSYAPRLRIVNGFVQSLNGLLDDALLTGDRRALTLFLAGERELRATLNQFVTPSWSVYQLAGNSSSGPASTLGYHVVLRDFLLGLCRRLKPGFDPLRPATLEGQARAAQAPSGGAPPAQPEPGGVAPGAEPPPPPPQSPDDKLPDPTPYCVTANDFSREIRAV